MVRYRDEFSPTCELFGIVFVLVYLRKPTVTTFLGFAFPVTIKNDSITRVEGDEPHTPLVPHVKDHKFITLRKCLVFNHYCHVFVLYVMCMLYCIYITILCCVVLCPTLFVCSVYKCFYCNLCCCQ